MINTGQTGGTPDADVDADEAWDLATGSSEVVVAVIDSGVDYTHPDLAANMWHNPGEVPGNKKDDDGNGYVDDYYGYDFANNDSDPMDVDGHGTHVAGTIGAAGNNGVGTAGVNWNVKIMALKRIPNDPAGTDHQLTAEIADAIEAINYATMMRRLYQTSGGTRGANVRLSNNSWGYFGIDIPHALKDAIDAAGDADMLFVACAHNQEWDIDANPLYPASLDSPNIISVAATDQNARIASFSNWGAAGVDLAAPGVMVYSTVPGGGYGWMSGTSMAAPHVAGAAALVWSAFPDLTAQEVKARLMASVDPIGQIGSNASFPTVTNGRLNVRNALLYRPPDHEATAPATIGNPRPPRHAVVATSPDRDRRRRGSGPATSYDVRHSSVPITEANWATATPRPASRPRERRARPSR